MSRDQRVDDNLGLLFVWGMALAVGVPVVVVFCLESGFLGSRKVRYEFMLKGVQEAASTFARKKIPFFFLPGESGMKIPEFFTE